MKPVGKPTAVVAAAPATALAAMLAVLAVTAVAAGAFAVAAEAPSAGTEAPRPAAAPATRTAIFAGGCFWCMEPPFDALDGVLETTSGYTGGSVENPTYERVSAGGTGHTEALRVVFDPARVSYERLLEVFWHNIDPLTPNAQFCDQGDQYRSAIFYLDDSQRAQAQASKRALESSQRFKSPVVTEIAPATTFYPAEEYHQDYYRKNPIRYRFYRANCGRDARLKELWGDQAGEPAHSPK